jgi:hypothetical protein
MAKKFNGEPVVYHQKTYIGIIELTAARRTKLIVALIVGLLLVFFLTFLHLRIHFGYYADDKAEVNAAEIKLIQQLNEQRFNDIYDAAADAFKAAQTRDKSTSVMKATYDLYGTITEDAEAATSCFPQQVRMVRWLKTSKGNELTEMSAWYVLNGKPTLLMFQVNQGHSPVSYSAAHGHPCDAVAPGQ